MPTLRQIRIDVDHLPPGDDGLGRHAPNARQPFNLKISGNVYLLQLLVNGSQTRQWLDHMILPILQPCDTGSYEYLPNDVDMATMILGLKRKMVSEKRAIISIRALELVKAFFYHTPRNSHCAGAPN
jgi:hypothetical protein